MKLKNEIKVLLPKYKEREQEIKEYAIRLKNAGGYNNYKIRLAWDILRGIMGTNYICDLYNKYDCNDSHIETLALKLIENFL